MSVTQLINEVNYLSQLMTPLTQGARVSATGSSSLVLSVWKEILDRKKVQGLDKYNNLKAFKATLSHR